MKLGSGAATALVVVAWRAAAELVVRMRALQASGELAARLERRAALSTAAALDAAGFLAPAREPARVRVGAVPVGQAGAARGAADSRVPAMPRLGVHAAVHVGAGTAAADIDDVGLLEGAMRRAAVERMDVAATGVRRELSARARRAAERGEPAIAAEVLAHAPAAAAAGEAPAAVLAPLPPKRREAARSRSAAAIERAGRAAAARERAERAARPSSRGPVPSPGARAAAQASIPSRPVPAPAPRPQRRDGGWTDWRWLAGEPEVALEGDSSAPRSATIAWAVPLVAAGVALTLVALVRPLASEAPWLAVAGLALAAAGWAAARRD